MTIIQRNERIIGREVFGMAIESRYKMSKERFEEIKEELVYLETVREKEVSELIKEARSFGDLSENSEYDEAKTEQGKLYSKIAELKVLIENADIIGRGDAPKDIVTLGSEVTVLDIEEKDEIVYKIVGSQEANPGHGRVSDESPMGRVLMGHKVGKELQYEAPMGPVKIKIVKIDNK